MTDAFRLVEGALPCWRPGLPASPSLDGQEGSISFSQSIPRSQNPPGPAFPKARHEISFGAGAAPARRRSTAANIPAALPIITCCLRLHLRSSGIP